MSERGRAPESTGSVTPVARHRQLGLDPQRSECRVPEAACVLFPSGSRAASDAPFGSERHFPQLQTPNLPASVQSRCVLCSYHLITSAVVYVT